MTEIYIIIHFFFKHSNDANILYRDIYDQVIEIANEITALKNIYGITKIGFALQSSVSNRHNVANAEDSTLTDGQVIYDTQMKLFKTLMYMINGQKNYFVQFDESAAW